MIDKIINWAWFLLNRREYKRFVAKVLAAGYDPRDIWYSRATGLICLPPFRDQ